jgi:hypothetical protein
VQGILQLQAGDRVIGVWGDPARCETEGLFGRLRSLVPPPPGTPAPLALGAAGVAGVAEELLTKAGLTVAGGAEVAIPSSSRVLTKHGPHIPQPARCRR